MASSRIGYVVVAAGSGSRLGADVPKAFVSVRGAPMLSHVLRTLSSLPHHRIIVAAPAEWIEQAEQQVAASAVAAQVIAGGPTRAESVARGLESLQSSGGVDVVLVHDAARPFMPAAVFERVIAEVEATGHGVVPALPIADTVKRVRDGLVLDSPDRASLRAVQTPQGFPFDAMRAAAEAMRPDQEYTDDASVFAANGGSVRVVEGDPAGLKITTPDHLDWAHGAVTRVGTGVDAHAFSDNPADELWLAGLHWPGERGLAGHSDGDVACHALVDAILGAAGLGDIGGMFGTDDPQFAGARGDVFLAEALRRATEAGWAVRNASVEIVGNRPKLAPRRSEAEARLSGLLGAPVNLAATTSDGLGLTGEGRGLGAIATVLLGPIA